MRSQSLETNQFFFKNSLVQKYTRISPYLFEIEIIISRSKKKKKKKRTNHVSLSKSRTKRNPWIDRWRIFRRERDFWRKLNLEDSRCGWRYRSRYARGDRGRRAKGGGGGRVCETANTVADRDGAGIIIGSEFHGDTSTGVSLFTTAPLNPR